MIIARGNLRQKLIFHRAVSGLSLRKRSINTNVIGELRDRGLISDITSNEIAKVVEKQATIYCGVDPTAPSMHLGNLVALMGLIHFHLGGHQVISLVGGATGMIGDPSGRNSERKQLSSDVLEENVRKLRLQSEYIFKNAQVYAESRIPKTKSESLLPIKFLSNYDWYKNLNVLEFLGTVGRVSRVGAMLSKESVKSRMSTEEGISYTEFSYQLLQAYDFYYLHKNHGCQIQIGGSDQWGNITAGIELIHKLNTLEVKKSIPNEGEPKRVRHENAFGLTIPLLTTSSGLKFGKSAGNAVWLDSNLTSPYELYQFFMKTSDQDIARYLPIFTLLSLEKINEIVTEHNKNPEKMLGQTVLASEVTELVHGSNEVKLAQELTAFFFGMKKGQNISDSNITSEYILKSFKNDSRLIRAKAEVIREMRITDLAVLTGACSSKSEAFRLIKNNGLYWNNTRVTSDKWMPSLDADYLDNGKFAIIRKGKTDFFILSVF